MVISIVVVVVSYIVIVFGTILKSKRDKKYLKDMEDRLNK